MYRLVLLLVLASLCDIVVDGYRSIGGYRYNYLRRSGWSFHKHDRRFDRLASHVASADRYLNGFCRQNANCNAYDIYEATTYKLIYNLPQCSVNYISVKIKHRVLYMAAKQTSYRPQTFVDMRILPDLLKLDEAAWQYNNGRLEIVIPYKKDFSTEWEKTCGDVSTRLIVVPQWGFQYRMSNRFGTDEDITVTNATEILDDPNDVPDTGTDSYDTPDLYSLNDPSTTETSNNDRLIFPS